jgi:predicted enzyme related to lactoylglutathione lyase
MKHSVFTASPDPSSGSIPKLNLKRVSKKLIFAVAIGISFCFGYAFNNLTSSGTDPQPKRVTSIGGVFFKCKDPKKLKEWYKVHLGLNTDAYGTSFEWRRSEDSTKFGYTQWSAFSEKSSYFGSADKQWMINYRVADLEWLVKELKKEGITPVDTLQAYDYGKFIHIMDLEGNKVELWEPDDKGYKNVAVAVTR